MDLNGIGCQLHLLQCYVRQDFQLTLANEQHTTPSERIRRQRRYVNSLGTCTAQTRAEQSRIVNQYAAAVKCPGTKEV